LICGVPGIDVSVADFVDLQHFSVPEVKAPASRPTSQASRMEAWLPSSWQP
jgi:hypothetical protein